jgi:hypothetical protein
MPITTEHEILTEEGWKKYNDIKRLKIESDGKPTGENEKLVSLDISKSIIIIEPFVGELYLSKQDRVMYTIKNDYIDTIIEENTKLPYKFKENDSIKIDTLVKIIYEMNINNIDHFYLINDITNIKIIKININDLIRNVINTDVFSFITYKQTYYVRKNNLEFLTIY